MTSYTAGIRSFLAADFKMQPIAAEDLVLLANLLINRAQAAIRTRDFAQALAVSSQTVCCCTLVTLVHRCVDQAWILDSSVNCSPTQVCRHEQAVDAQLPRKQQ